MGKPNFIDPSILTSPVLDRFWSKVDRRGANCCWIWNASTTHAGYGKLCIITDGKKRFFLSHRISYIVHYGSFDRDLLVCHTCDNPKCVNPKHLWLGTNLTNAIDKMNKGRDNLIQARRTRRNKGYKLTEAQVIEIRSLYPNGMSYRRLASIFGVSPPMIRNIIKRKSWRFAGKLSL